MNIKTLYGQYKALFKKEKKIGNIDGGMRQETFKQFENDMKDPNFGSVAKILDAQRYVKKDQKAQLWKDYQKIVKEQKLKPGQRISQKGTYWGETETAIDGLRYHRTFSGLLTDERYVKHCVIAYRLAHGEDKKEVLADYGY